MPNTEEKKKKSPTLLLAHDVWGGEKMVIFSTSAKKENSLSFLKM